MSYCRFSTDDYQCDVYCYASVGDFFAIHVAGYRPKYAEPLPPDVPFGSDSLTEWLERHNKVMAMLETAERVPIGLPHDGESFEEPDVGSAADRLEALRAIGYNVPQFAIDALREEAAETPE